MDTSSKLNYNDLRVRKTEKAIRKAFHELAQEKDIKKITVRELAEKAEINKTTFYAHYDTIQDLLRTIEQETIDYIIENLGEFHLLFEQPDVFIDNLYHLLRDCQAENISHLNFNHQYFSEKVNTAILEKMKQLNLDMEKFYQLHPISIFLINGLLGLLRNQSQTSDSDLKHIKSFVKNGIRFYDIS